MSKIKTYLFFSQVILLASMVICSFIEPSVVRRNGGVSNFGNDHSTVAIYVLGFVANIIFILLSARLISGLGKQFRLIALSLLLMGLIVIAVLISTFPRHLSQAFSDIHDDLGIALFSYQFFISIWILTKNHLFRVVLFFCIETIGSLIGLLSITKVIHFLFFGQFIGAIGFALLFVLILPDIIEHQLKMRKTQVSNV